MARPYVTDADFSSLGKRVPHVPASHVGGFVGAPPPWRACLPQADAAYLQLLR